MRDTISLESLASRWRLNIYIWLSCAGVKVTQLHQPYINLKFVIFLETVKTPYWNTCYLPCFKTSICTKIGKGNYSNISPPVSLAGRHLDNRVCCLLPLLWGVQPSCCWTFGTINKHIRFLHIIQQNKLFFRQDWPRQSQSRSRNCS